LKVIREQDGGCVEQKRNGNLEFTLEKVIIDVKGTPFAVEVVL
jgi:hypothetical protein